ncbi:cytoplasmic protein [Virgibacillus indicus]|uniref:Cytoplasmic protein n=1 Tax=Virgibacillus indicus TaxID=2024554 RepID=A0A265NAS8_9BACI|nr:SAV0927 family protein [Virgibacillus indicus]OZU88574.1 cytoplasmic protein [Virgibacillus indicus]
MSKKYEFLKDETKTTKVRYISFMGEYHRYDFAFMEHEEDPAKIIVLFLQKNRLAVIGKHSLNEPGNIEHNLHVSEIEAGEIRRFFREII